MNELTITKKYPTEKYNFLGNTEVMVEVPDIKSPVIQAVQLDPDPKKGDVYIQQKAKDAYTDKKGVYHPATPNLYAITKNGLKKLADGAGIKMVSSEHVIPTTCQKCVAVNQNCGKVVQCGNCKNKDVAYRVTISVPQLTGEVLTVEDTHETIVENVTPGMTPNQRAEFMKHIPQICEAKALNGAIRTALHIKGTYTLEELQKPFIVAYLVPNLNHKEVKEAAIDSMFQSSQKLFGKANSSSIQQIETSILQQEAINDLNEKNYDKYVNESYKEEVIEELSDMEFLNDNIREQDFYCDKCGEHISQKVWDYSIEKFERPLCYKCQQIVRSEQKK